MPSRTDQGMEESSYTELGCKTDDYLTSVLRFYISLKWIFNPCLIAVSDSYNLSDINPDKKHIN